MNRAARISLAAAVLAAAAGCFRRHCQPLAFETVVNDHESNAAKVTTLSGRLDVSVRAPGRRLFIPLEGLLNFRKPGLVHLEIRKFGQRQVSLGANDRTYWFWSMEPLLDERTNTVRRGSVDRMDRGEAAGLLLCPDAVAEALGVASLKPAEPDLHALPERHADAYVFDYVKTTGGAVRLVRKVHLDPCTGRPTHVDYVAADGTRVLVITFANYQVKDGVRRPMEVTLDFPVEDAAVRFGLAELHLNRELPAEAFDEPEFPGAAVIEIDEAR